MGFINVAEKLAQKGFHVTEHEVNLARRMDLVAREVTSGVEKLSPVARKTLLEGYQSFLKAAPEGTNKFDALRTFTKEVRDDFRREYPTKESADTAFKKFQTAMSEEVRRAEGLDPKANKVEKTVPKSDKAGASTPEPTKSAPTVAIPPQTFGGVMAHTAMGFFNSFGTKTKQWVVGSALVYMGAVDNPFIQGTESMAVQAYKSIRGVIQGVPTAQNNADIAAAQAGEAGASRTTQLTKLNQSATSALAAMGKNSASPLLITAPSLARKFEQAVKDHSSGIEDSKLHAFSANFASIGTQLGVGQDGQLNGKDQLKLANSKEFSDLIDNLPLATKEKTQILKALIPAPSANP